MSKPRSDSLYARLKPEQREALFTWLIVECASFEDAAARCAEEFGLHPSVGALHAFLSRHGFAWRLEQAKAKAEELRGALPEDFDARRRQALAQREFEAAFGDLSIKELVQLRQLEIDERLAALREKIEPGKLAVQKRRVALLEDQAARAKEALTKIASKGGVSPETLKEIEEAVALL